MAKSKSRKLADLLADGAIDTTELADGSITTAKLASGAVTGSELSSNAITESLGYNPAAMQVYKYGLHGSSINEAGLTDNRRVVLGTCYLPQGGADVRITLYCGEGYNAAARQYDEYVIRFRTSNGGSHIAGSSGSFYANGWVEHIKYDTGDPIAAVYVEQIDSQHYRFSIDPSTLLGFYSHYEVTAWTSGTTVWTHSGTLSDGLPSTNYISLSTTAVRSGGITQNPNQPAFSAMRGSAGNGSYPSSDAIVDLGQTYYNNGSHYNTSNYRFTAPVSGYYQFSAGGTSYTGSRDDYITLYLKRNGSPLNDGGRGRDTTAGGGNQYVNPALFATVYLTQGDYIELWNYSSTGTVVYHNYEFHFEGRLVG
jgi:hypothetical protein